MKSYIAAFKELSTSEKVTTVLLTFVVVNFFIFLMSILFCLIASLSKLAAVVLCGVGVVYICKVLKDTLFNL